MDIPTSSKKNEKTFEEVMTLNFKDFNSKLKDSAQFNIKNRCQDIAVGDYISEAPQGFKSHRLNRLALSALSMAFIMIIAFSVYLNLKPISVLTIDFNPSIELELNRFNRVVGIKAANTDAQAFIAQLDYRNKKIDDVVESIYDLGVEEAYFTEDEAYMLVGIYGEDFKKENKISAILADLSQITFLTLTEHSNREINQLVVGEMQIYYRATTTQEPANAIDASDGYTVTMDETLTYNDGDVVNNLEVLATDYQVSQAKINIAVQIYSAYDTYTTQADFAALVSMDISDLIILYNQINEPL